MSNQKFIWTNHALKRLSERKISEKYIIQTLSHPDKTLHQNDKTIEIQKRIEGRTVAIIVKRNERGENLLVSCWVNPPFPGTKDYKKRQRYFAMKNASFSKKLWLTLLNLLGI
jgi:hypothetical protein